MLRQGGRLALRLRSIVEDVTSGVRSISVSSALRADEVIGIDLGTTNSCVAVMEGKVCMGGFIKG